MTSWGGCVLTELSISAAAVPRRHGIEACGTLTELRVSVAAERARVTARAMDGLGYHAGDVPNTGELFRECSELFEGVRPENRPKIMFYGKPAHNPRDAIWFGRPAEDGMMPLYRTYSTAYKSPKTKKGIAKAEPIKPMPGWMMHVLDELSIRHGLPPLNHVVLHRYLNGADNIGWHHDKYMDFEPGSSIVSVSLGATRCFQARKGERIVSIDVADGDVVTLSDACNRRAKHRIRRTTADVGVRFSITARTIDTHYDPAHKVFRHRESPVPVSYRRPVPNSNA